MKKFFALLLLPLFLAGCGAATTQVDLSTQTPQSGTVTISIKSLRFNPNAIVVTPGTTIIWKNDDSTTHDIISDSGTWSPATLARGETMQTTLSTEGTYTYHCGIHPTMKGTIVVKTI